MRLHFSNITDAEPLPAFPKLCSDLDTDVVIAGAGFTGLIHAWYLLEKTNCDVVLLEKDRLGSGSSRASLGQFISAVETGLADVYATEGEGMVRSILKNDEMARSALNALTKKLGLPDPAWKVSFLFFETPDQVQPLMEEMVILHKSGVRHRFVLLEKYRKEVLEKYWPFCRFVSRLPEQSGRKYLKLEAAGFVEFHFRYALLDLHFLSRVLLNHILTHYGNRFRIFEGSAVTKIEDKERPCFHTGNYTVRFRFIVLSTNGMDIRRLIPGKSMHYRSTYHYVVAFKTDNRMENSAGGFYKGKDFSYYIFQTFREQQYFILGGIDFSSEPDKVQLERRVLRFCRQKLDTVFWAELPEIEVFGGRLCYTRNGLRVHSNAGISVIQSWGCNGIGLLQALRDAELHAELIGNSFK